MVCSKPYTVTIVTGVLFVWDVAAIIPSDFGAASFSPDNAAGNTAVGSVSVILADVGNSLVSNVGRFILNSTAAIPCNMHIEVVSVAPGTAAFWTLTVINGGLLVNEGDATLGFNAVADIPFSLPNTGGINTSIDWQIDALVSTIDGTAQSVSVTATFTVL